MKLYILLKQLFKPAKSPRPRHTASTSRELDKEFVDFVVRHSKGK